MINFFKLKNLQKNHGNKIANASRKYALFEITAAQMLTLISLSQVLPYNRKFLL